MSLINPNYHFQPVADHNVISYPAISQTRNGVFNHINPSNTSFEPILMEFQLPQMHRPPSVSFSTEFLKRLPQVAIGTLGGTLLPIGIIVAFEAVCEAAANAASCICFCDSGSTNSNAIKVDSEHDRSVGWTAAVGGVVGDGIGGVTAWKLITNTATETASSASGTLDTAIELSSHQIAKIVGGTIIGGLAVGSLVGLTAALVKAAQMKRHSNVHTAGTYIEMA